MYRNLILMISMLVVLFWQPASRAEAIPVIAAASDLSYALVDASRQFIRTTGKQLRISFGSSGNFKRLIEQGAPFEMFLSADENYVLQLAEQGYTQGRGHIYAIGRLALFAPHGSALAEHLDLAALPVMLADGRVRKFAIANPQHAPYGRAAREVLVTLKLWPQIERHLVFGESASQATLFATSGATQGAIIPHALALSPPIAAQGRFRLIDDQLHQPLRQRMVLLNNASDTTRQFYVFLQSAVGRDILRDYGFVL